MQALWLDEGKSKAFACGFIDFYYKEGRLLCRLQMFGSAKLKAKES